MTRDSLRERPSWFHPYYRELDYHTENQYRDLIELVPEVVIYPKDAEELRGKWTTPQRQLHVEVGCAEGHFLSALAPTMPHVDFVGLERKFKRVHMAVKRFEREGAKGIRLVRYDATCIDLLFAQNEIHTLYLLFPDPWPKKRHRKNRMVTGERLHTWHFLIKPGGCVEIKTDHREYFDHIVRQIQEFDLFDIEAKSEYLQHEPDMAAHLPTTRFERLFSRKGMPIHYIRLRKPASP